MDAEQEEVLTYRKELDAIERRLTDAGIPHTTRRLIRGLTPAEDLAQVVTEEKADLLAIGIRTQSRVGKLLMGSDGQEILLTAPCPVVAVKATL
jgi:nucleotide-binding universal stress UspA family protein